MLSRYFVARPVLACVVAIFIVIAGLAALRQMPVAELPTILPPQVTVQANYPGASADTLAATVAAPLEQQLNGVERMLYMNSVASADGVLNITLTFAVGANLDLAAINVNNRVQVALSRLPEEVRRQGVTVTKNGSAVLMIIALQSTDQQIDELTLSNFVTRNVVDELKRIPGVASATNYSNKNYSLRIWLDPGKLARFKLSPADVARAVREQNSQYTAGAVGDEPMPMNAELRLSVTAEGRFTDPEQFENIILQTGERGALVRLKDVARVELGAQRYDFIARLNGQPVVPIGIRLLTDGNAIDVSNAVRARLAELANSFPQGVNYTIPFDTSQYVRVSVREVVKTFIEALALVFLVVLVFLRKLRATLIPMVAVPVSLIGSLVVLYAMDVSINTLTLFGMVLAIGIVVDDAIVVLENVERIMAEEGVSARVATDKAMRQVTRPVIAVVLALTAVFVPVAFLGGLVGVLYQQFAITLVAAVLLSGWVALTLTPALCVLFLESQASLASDTLARAHRAIGGMTAMYLRAVTWVLARPITALAALVVAAVCALALYRHLPTALVPDEDKGYVMAVSLLPDGAALRRTVDTTQQATAMLQQHPAVDSVFSFIGYDTLSGSVRSNSAVVWIMLKDWSDRHGADMSQRGVVDAVSKVSNQMRDGVVLGFEPPPITGLSNTGGFEAYVQARADVDPKRLESVTAAFVKAANARPELRGVASSFSASGPQLKLAIDRENAKLLGVSLDEVFTALQSTFGAYYINDFNHDGRIYQVQMQAEAQFRAHAENIRDVYVKSASGELIALTALASVQEVTGPEHVQRFNGFVSADLNGSVANGYSSGQALHAMEEVAAQSLPAGYALAWSGSYALQKLEGGASQGVLLLGVLMVFLILAAQFERWHLPLAVILSVPFAMLGAILATWLAGMTNEVYFQIGMITLVGLSAKNAVLIVEFANGKVAEGMSVRDAALQAAQQRFRPILMTSMAFLFGVLPLALSSGAGAGSRHAIAISVIGGMLFATFVATVFVPAFYLWLAARFPSSHDKPRATP